MTQFDPLPGTEPETPDVPRAIKVLAGVSFAALLASVLALAFTFSNDNSDAAASSAAPAAAAASGETQAAPAVREVSDPADLVMKPYDPVTKPVAAGDKTFELVTTEKVIQVGDKRLKMWTFNNSVPGPVLRAVVGDTITIKISNDASSTFHHSVDFHASRLTLGGGHVQVKPGGAGEYKFKLEYPGVFMYHCATAPVLQHIGMGMYGMIIVQPKEGFGGPMPEFAITQSELYASAADIEEKRPANVVFNGIPSQYAKNPIKLPANSKARLFVLNAGPSEVSSFHVVGTVFDRVFADGNPRNVTYGRQTFGLAASGSGVFEMELVGEGQFPMVTHQFNHAAKGAVGMFLAGDGKPGPGGLPDPASNGHH
jgi:nitrite reductase (NO-forming)